MSILEVEEIGEGTPQGVALFLVGSDPENGKEQESSRTLRMYNLSSLISLARWAISRKVRRSLFIGASTLRDHGLCRAPRLWIFTDRLAGIHNERH
jgi:hypothetical protein